MISMEYVPIEVAIVRQINIMFKFDYTKTKTRKVIFYIIIDLKMGWVIELDIISLRDHNVATICIDCKQLLITYRFYNFEHLIHCYVHPKAR
jgi:hypothetical protein